MSQLDPVTNSEMHSHSAFESHCRLTDPSASQPHSTITYFRSLLLTTSIYLTNTGISNQSVTFSTLAIWKVDHIFSTLITFVAYNMRQASTYSVEITIIAIGTLEITSTCYISKTRQKLFNKCIPQRLPSQSGKPKCRSLQ